MYVSTYWFRDSCAGGSQDEIDLKWSHLKVSSWGLIWDPTLPNTYIHTTKHREVYQLIYHNWCLIRNEVYWIPVLFCFQNSKFWNRNSDLSIFQQQNSKKTSNWNLRNQKQNRNSTSNGSPRNWNWKSEFPTKVVAKGQAKGHMIKIGAWQRCHHCSLSPILPNEIFCNLHRSDRIFWNNCTQHPTISMDEGVCAPSEIFSPSEVLATEDWDTTI